MFLNQTENISNFNLVVVPYIYFIVGVFLSLSAAVIYVIGYYSNWLITQYGRCIYLYCAFNVL